MAAQTTAWVNFNGKDVGVKITIDGINDKIDKLGKKGKKNIDSLSASFKNLKSSISQMSGSMGSLPLIGGLGAAGIFAGGKTAVEKFAGRETLETAITFFSKTEDVAKSNLSFLKNTSNSLGIVYDVAADGYKRLLANMSLMNIPMSEQNDKFLKISSAIRAMGLDAGQSESVFRAFGDMMAKGSIQAQELKTQLANAMPGTMGYMAKAVGGDAAKVAKMLDTGAITWAKYGDKLIDIMYNSTKEGLDKAVLTTSAGLARIQNTWDNTMVGIGDAIVRSGALDVISQMGKELEVWVSANKEMIASSIKGGVDFVKKGFEWAVANKDDIKNILLGFGTFFVAVKTANLIMAFTNPIAAAAIGMTTIATAIWRAVDGINAAKEAEKSKIDNIKQSQFSFDESLTAGGKNSIYGVSNLFRKGQRKEGLEQILGGLHQLSSGTIQAGATALSYLPIGASSVSAEALAKTQGINALKVEKMLYPQDFRPEMSAPTAGNYVLDATYPKDLVSREPQSQPSINEMLKMFADAMSNMTQNVTINKDNVAIDYSYGATKGPAINIQNND